MYSIAKSNRLCRVLAATVFCLPAWGLSGCSGYSNKYRMVDAPTETSQPEAQQAHAPSKKFIDWAGYIGEKVGYISGGVLGGIAGACIDGAYVLCNGNNIDPKVPIVCRHEIFCIFGF